MAERKKVFYVYLAVSAEDKSEALKIADEKIMEAIAQESTVANTMHVGEANINIIDVDETIVDNWFPKDTLSELVEDDISDEEYKAFKKWLDDSSMANNSSNAIAELYNEWKNNKDNDNE